MPGHILIKTINWISPLNPAKSTKSPCTECFHETLLTITMAIFQSV